MLFRGTCLNRFSSVVVYMNCMPIVVIPEDCQLLQHTVAHDVGAPMHCV